MGPRILMTSIIRAGLFKFLNPRRQGNPLDPQRPEAALNSKPETLNSKPYVNPRPYTLNPGVRGSFSVAECFVAFRPTGDSVAWRAPNPRGSIMAHPYIYIYMHTQRVMYIYIYIYTYT